MSVSDVLRGSKGPDRGTPAVRTTRDASLGSQGSVSGTLADRAARDVLRAHSAGGPGIRSTRTQNTQSSEIKNSNCWNSKGF